MNIKPHMDIDPAEGGEKAMARIINFNLKNLRELMNHIGSLMNRQFEQVDRDNAKTHALLEEIKGQGLNQEQLNELTARLLEADKKLDAAAPDKA